MIKYGAYSDETYAIVTVQKGKNSCKLFFEFLSQSLSFLLNKIFALPKRFPKLNNRQILQLEIMTGPC